MLIKELNSLSTTNIYRLEPYYNKIIVNENHDGIKILDFSLNTIKTISLMTNIEIHSIYKQSDGNCIIIHDFDNEQLILVDLTTEKSIFMKISKLINQPFYPYHYYWKKDILIFALEKNNSFYKLNFESLSLEKIDSKIVKLIAPSFFDFCYICNLYYRRYKTIIIDSDKESCSFFKNRKLMGFYQHTNKILNLSNHRFTLSEKIYYYKNSLIFFDLPSKSIIFKKNKLFLNSEKSYMCLDVLIY